MQKLKTILASFAHIYIYICIINFSHLYSQIPLKTITLDGQQVMVAANELCVKLKNGVSDQTLRNFVAQYGGVVDPLDYNAPLGWRVIKFNNNVQIENLYSSFNNQTLFSKVEYNYFGSIDGEIIPNDPLFNKQWAFKNYGYFGGVPNEDIGVTKAWNITQGSQSVVISIFDTGLPLNNNFSISHPDIKDQAIIIGVDVTGDGDSLKDLNGHGTHVLGIIGAKSNNQLGVAGICWNCKFLVVQVFRNDNDPSYAASVSYFRRAIEFLIRWKWQNNYNNTLVVNYSGSIPQINDIYLNQMEDAIKLANEEGVLLVVSMGNQGYDPKKSIRYPAKFSEKYSNIIAVGAVDNKGTVTWYSNKASHINLVAPGGNSDLGLQEEAQILSTLPDYQNFSGYMNYGYMYGTSMATPMVTGTIGLILSLENYEPNLIRNLLQTQAKDKGTPGFDIQYGFGVINSYKSLKSVQLRPQNLTISLINNRPKLSWDHVFGAIEYEIIKGEIKDKNTSYEVIGTTTDNFFVDYSEYIDPYQTMGRKIIYRVKAILNPYIISDITETAFSKAVVVLANGGGLEKKGKILVNKADFYPNPFNNSTTINLSVKELSNLNVEVFNAIGQKVFELNRSNLFPGEYKFEINLNSHPSGIYYSLIKIGNSLITKKISLIK